MADFVAVAFEGFELEKILLFAEKNREAKIVCVCREYWPENPLNLKNVELVKEDELLSEKEIDKLDKEALFFSRNWHKFDKGFCKAATFKGIQMGFVSEHAFFKIFRRILLQVKTKSKLAESRPKSKFSLLGLLWLLPEKKQDKKPAQNFQKFVKMGGKALEVVAGYFSDKKKSATKTVFVKSNNYLGKFPEELQKDPGLRVVSLDNFVVRKLLNPINSFKYARTIAKKSAFFEEAFDKCKESDSFRKKMEFESTPFVDEFADCLKFYIHRAWPEFVFLINILSEEFERHKPAVVVLWEDFTPFERICAIVAKKAGAKSLVVQHGMFKPDTKNRDWIRGFAPLTADKIAVWSEKFKILLEEHKVLDSKIVVTGAPRFDALHNKTFNAKEFRQSIGIKPNEKIIALFETLYMSKKQLETILEAAAEISSKFSNRVVIKIRLWENPAEYKWLEGKAIVLRDIDLPELLNALDTAIVATSTTGLEAMILGKPVILFGGWQPFGNPYSSTSAVLKAKSKEELKAALNRALKGKNKKLEKKMKEFVYENTFRQDGNATKRVIELVKKMFLSANSHVEKNSR